VRVVHLLALFLELIPVPAAGRASLFYLGPFVPDLLPIPLHLPLAIAGFFIVGTVVSIAIAAVWIGRTAPGERYYERAQGAGSYECCTV